MVKPTGESKEQIAHVREVVGRAMELAKQGKSVRIRFAPGDYYFDKTLHGPVVDLVGVSNVLVDGTGARMHFVANSQGLIRANGCDHIAVTVSPYTLGRPRSIRW